MGVPHELRLMIYHEMLAWDGADVHIPCCRYHSDLFRLDAVLTSFDQQLQTPQKCIPLLQLLRTNRQLRSEVVPFLYSAADFHFCLDLYCNQSDSRATGPQLVAFMGAEFSSYPDEYESFTKLNAWTHNVQIVTMHLEFPPTEVDASLPSNVRLLLWESRDNLRATISTLNRSGNLRKLNIVCTVGRNHEIGQLTDVALQYLRPLHQLNSGLEVKVLFASRESPSCLQELEFPHSNFNYIRLLQDSQYRNAVARTEPLHEEWIRVRTWCIRAFSLFCMELQPVPGDGDQYYEDTNDNVTLSLVTALEAAWDSQDEGNRIDFGSAKTLLHDVWLQNYLLYDSLLTDLPNSDGASLEVHGIADGYASNDQPP